MPPAENGSALNLTSPDGLVPARPGPDHGWFGWSPIPSRPVTAWPGGAPVAFTVIVDMGAAEWEVETARIPVPGGRGTASYPDFPRMSHREYGHRVGIFRLLGMLAGAGIRPAVAIDVLTASDYPGLLRHLLPAAGEFLAQGMSASRPITSEMSADEERHYIATTLECLEAALGRRPTGWMGPEQAESARTPSLLAEAGLRYVADWSNDEQPYPMDGAGPGFWSVPVSWELADVNVLQIRDVAPADYGRSIAEAFDVLCADGSDSPRVMALHLHPWLSAQPLRADFVQDALCHVTASGRAWVATPGEIVEWWADRQGG